MLTMVGVVQYISLEHGLSVLMETIFLDTYFLHYKCPMVYSSLNYENGEQIPYLQLRPLNYQPPSSQTDTSPSSHPSPPAPRHLNTPSPHPLPQTAADSLS